MCEPIVSIIVPVYKVEKFLQKCLDSIINQTYQNLDIVLVDDGSPDKCGIICDEYAAHDSRIRVFHKSNGGVSSARNMGLQGASGEFVCFVDADDWLEPNAIKLLVSQQRITDADVVWGNMVMYTNNGRFRIEEPRYNNKHEWIMNYCGLRTGMVMVCYRRIIRRYLIEKYDIKFPDGFNYSEDKLFMSQIAYYAHSFSSIDEYIYNYNRINNYSATALQNISFNSKIFQQESRCILLIELFFSNKENVYYKEIGKSRMLYLRRNLDQAIRHSSYDGFYLVVKQIQSSNQKFWGMIGWDSWKRLLYENYYIMKIYSEIKRIIKLLKIL